MSQRFHYASQEWLEHDDPLILTQDADERSWWNDLPEGKRRDYLTFTNQPINDATMADRKEPNA